MRIPLILVRLCSLYNSSSGTRNLFFHLKRPREVFLDLLEKPQRFVSQLRDAETILIFLKRL